MRIPGDKRTDGDKPMVVRCRCGGVLVTLAVGESLARGADAPAARSRTATCAGCARTQTVWVIAAGVP